MAVVEVPELVAERPTLEDSQVLSTLHHLAPTLSPALQTIASWSQVAVAVAAGLRELRLTQMEARLAKTAPVVRLQTSALATQLQAKEQPKLAVEQLATERSHRPGKVRLQVLLRKVLHQHGLQAQQAVAVAVDILVAVLVEFLKMQHLPRKQTVLVAVAVAARGPVDQE